MVLSYRYLIGPMQSSRAACARRVAGRDRRHRRCGVCSTGAGPRPQAFQERAMTTGRTAKLRGFDAWLITARASPPKVWASVVYPTTDALSLAGARCGIQVLSEALPV
jgi:hypothetical protein